MLKELSKNMTEQEFRDLADHALEDLHRRLSAADLECEADFSGGALVIEFDDTPAKFVVSPNAPVKQVWVSANLKSHKLDWDPARITFALPAGGMSLADLIADAIAQQIGRTVRF